MYCYFNGYSLCYIIYTCNLSQFTCLDILQVCMKYKNLTSLYRITLLNVSFMYTENQIRKCYHFCFNHKPQFRKLNRKGKSIVFTIYLLFPLFFLSDIQDSPFYYSFLFKELLSSICSFRIRSSGDSFLYFPYSESVLIFLLFLKVIFC